ncbi:MAG: hypothetical protein RL518_2613 [Pseudomonadota bacterium]|jgi:hypothetical protein
MTAAYHITGILQASLFALSISAVYVQLRFVRRRRVSISTTGTREAATDNLSMLAILGSFAAFLSFVLLSSATEPFAHYIFWSRLPACVLAVLLLWEYRRDYPSGIRALMGPLSGVLFIGAVSVTALLPGTSRQFLAELHSFVIVAGVILIGGQVHQLWLLLTRRRVGALSLRARTLNLLKDLSTVAFGLTLGVHQSWSIVAVATANVALTAAVLGVGARLSRKQEP